MDRTGDGRPGPIGQTYGGRVMKVIETVAGFEEIRSRIPGPVGLVPTMGALHDGHLALVRRARDDNATAVVSIFVNPTQFQHTDDLSSYPGDLASDLSKLDHESVDVVFAPSAREIYPEGFGTYVDVGRVSSRLEGEFRPGHFRGVATVVCKLLAIVRPDRAYFGQKDAQQCLVVRRLNADLNLGAEIVAVPTVRDANGLALSSRNVHLGKREREAAAVLVKSLCLARGLWQDGMRDAERIRRRMRRLIEAEPLARVDYVSVADAVSLDELDLIDRPALVSLAVRIGETRLIDNITICPPPAG